MYPTSSSSSQKPIPAQSGLTRFSSAPSSLLTTAVNEVTGPDCELSAVGSRSRLGHYFSGDSSSITSESTCKVNSSIDSNQPKLGLQRSYGLHETAAGDFPTPSHLRSAAAAGGAGSPSSPSALVRQKSSPADFLSYLTDPIEHNGGFSISKGSGSYSSQEDGPGVSRLKSQLSFTGQDSLSHISEDSENIVDGISSDNGHHRTTHSYATTSFGMDSWDNNSKSIMFAPPSKRAKDIDGDILNCLNTLDSQFSLPQTTLEMATVEKLLNIPEDSVPCKIRAKRGCATHPRSIAERERRTRISGKLKKLQELVPNMDKQTSYADMLDLAVQHIKGLQGQIQKLHQELDNCTCGCKEST
ncbi:hypothetical protein L6164_012166 [Bauhinia variegata]|uniref:Uncharacterized protein n=1 Tax=Bauhinia variegata TaxID=167791 RepID=A0ACB9P9I3_BAUVA|nr:hypothetical protein L6164_012166 [Bauhinia variegata]